MLSFRPVAAILAACVVAAISTASASAQDRRLRIPTIAAGAAAAADWASTYHSLTHYQVREANPLLHPWRDSPRDLVSVGALVDMAGIATWNLTVGRRNQRVAAAGLWTMAAFRTAIAIHNVRHRRTTPRR